MASPHIKLQLLEQQIDHLSSIDKNTVKNLIKDYVNDTLDSKLALIAMDFVLTKNDTTNELNKV